ncbi:disulfide bond formation protein B [Rubrimonas cliftonensis]|uniref:Disulfide bond formation protein DsbB n=1 Tax=Rubrimonas cliftonensis TaxID=89524 RepID=A0A1H3XRR5_9RHOB|nr:disulfide bond formation protein B [Rubrimonas cliftonensis]SEA01274.1 disulfide bond formation protein DsbB [Rubrimonas cliftonensis]
MTGARPRTIGALVAAASALLLAAALWFQFVEGLAPCTLCVWQRWPHVAALVLAGAGAWFGWRWAIALAALALLGGAGVAMFHVGVEQGWWEGLSTCAAGPITGLSTDALLAQIRDAPVARCDEAAWSLFGLSMAAWNAVASLGLATAAAFAASPFGGRAKVQASSSASQYR